MKGIEFLIEKTTSEIETVLIHPQVESTLEVFELSFARFSLQALQIAQILLANSNLEKHIPTLFQRLASKLKDSRSCKPEKPESQEEIYLQDDEITRFLSTRKDTRNSQNISELEWFLGEAEKKKKDTLNFLEHVSKLSNKMEVSMQSVVKENNETQTEIIWISEMMTIEGSSLDIKNVFAVPQKICNCSEKNKDLEKQKEEYPKSFEELNKIEESTGELQEGRENNEEIHILEPLKKLQNVKQKKTRDSKRISTFTPKKNHQDRENRSPQSLLAETETNIPSILKEIKEIKERSKIINSVSSSPSKPTPKVPVFKPKIERMVSLSESGEENVRNSLSKSSMCLESEEIDKKVFVDENETSRRKREEKWFDKNKAKTEELGEKIEEENGLPTSKNIEEDLLKYEHSKLELILESEEMVNMDNTESNLFQNLTSKLKENIILPHTSNLTVKLSSELGSKKSGSKIEYVGEHSRSISKKDENLKEKKERRANYLKELLSLKKENKEPFKEVSLPENQNVNYSNKVRDDKLPTNYKKMSKIYTVHHEIEIEGSPVLRQSDDKHIQKSESKLSFEGFEEKFQPQTVQRFDNRLKATENKDDFKTLPSIHKSKLELNKLLPKEDSKIPLNLIAKMKNERAETFHESLKENYDGHTEQIEEIDHESSSIAEMMKKDKVIIDKISELQKNGKQNENQIRFYVDVLERTHLRFCGKNCKHLERFYKHLKISNTWLNRVPITLATRKIGFFS